MSATARCSRWPNQPTGSSSRTTSTATPSQGRRVARAARRAATPLSTITPASSQPSGWARRVNGTSSHTMSGGLISRTSR